MPYRRQTRLQAGLESMFRYLADQSQTIGNYALRQDSLRQQRAFDTQKESDQHLQSLIAALGSDPSKADYLIQAAKADPLLNGSRTGIAANLERFRPTDERLTSPLLDQINKAKSPLDIPADLPAAVQTSGVRPSSLSESNIPPDFQLAPAQKENSPLNSVVAAAQAKQHQFDVEDAAKAEQAGNIAYSTETGKNRAVNEQAPKALESKVTEFNTMTPLEVGRQGQLTGATEDAKMTGPRVNARVSEAGRTSNAQAMGQLTPGVIAAEAQKAGAVESAREGAKLPTESERKASAFLGEGLKGDQLATQLENGGLNPNVPLNTPGWMKSSLQRQYELAVRQFASIIYNKSGANISKEEMDNTRKLYFLNSGDGPTEIRLRQAARQKVLAGMQYQAGKAAPEAYKDMPALSPQSSHGPMTLEQKAALFGLIPPGGK